MNLLRENLFSESPMDRNETPLRFRVAQAVRKRPPASFSGAETWLRRARGPRHRLWPFVKADGGADLLAPTCGVAFIHAGRLTVFLRMTPGPEGFLSPMAARRPDLAPAIWAFFDLDHDHHRAVRIHVPLRGRPSAVRVWGCEGLLASDHQSGEEGAVRRSWAATSAVRNGVWWVRLAVSLDRFAPDAPVIGFQVERLQDIGGHVEESSWSPSRVWRPIPSFFGELVLAQTDVTVESLDLRDPIHGMNRVAVRVTNHGPVAARLTFRAYTDAPSLRAEHTARACVPPRSSSTVRLSYETSVLDWSDQVVTFSIETESGEAIYRAHYRAGSAWSRKFGASYLQLKHRLPQGERRGLPSPDPAAPDYYRKKRLHILSNMPDFRRDPMTNRIIVGIVGGRVVVRFDLGRRGVLDRIARFLVRLFDTDDDRLVAATYFLNQACTWSGAFNAINAVANPLTMLRLGYVLCGDYAYMLAAILAHMTDHRTCKPFTAHYACAHNHIICAVDRGDDHVPLDANMGWFFPSRDNRRLATLRELYEDQDLVRRVTPGRLSDYAEAPDKVFLLRTMHTFPSAAPGR